MHEMLKDIESPYLYPYFLSQAIAQGAGDQWLILYALEGGAYDPVACFGACTPDMTHSCLDKDSMLSSLSDSKEIEPRSFLKGIGEGSVRITPILKPDLMLVRYPGSRDAYFSSSLADSAYEFRKRRLDGPLPPTLSPSGLFSELKADPAARTAPFCSLYILDLAPLLACFGKACPNIDFRVFSSDCLRFLTRALKDTGTVRSISDHTALVAQFAPRPSDAELLGSQLAGSMRRAFAVEQGPRVKSFLAIDLREPESAQALRDFLAESH
ncbi:MAG TPA: hypothetical protein DCG47_06790 [Spirochaetaceae bacterium]|jgi:hypothetical protein|nr:hypothetical protein [Spirochaetaceae bacterium]